MVAFLDARGFRNDATNLRNGAGDLVTRDYRRGDIGVVLEKSIDQEHIGSAHPARRHLDQHLVCLDIGDRYVFKDKRFVIFEYARRFHVLLLSSAIQASSTAAAAASATAISSSTVPALVPTAPTIVPPIKTGRPPPKITTLPPLLCSMPKSGAPGCAIFARSEVRLSKSRAVIALPMARSMLPISAPSCRVKAMSAPPASTTAIL